MTAARPFPLVPLLVAAVVAFAAAFGIGLAAKKSSSSSPAAPAGPQPVALPSQAPKVASLTAAGAVPALRTAPKKRQAPKATAPSTAAPTPSTPTAPVQSAPTAPAPSAPAPSAPAPSQPKPKTGGGVVVGGGSQ